MPIRRARPTEPAPSPHAVVVTLTPADAALYYQRHGQLRGHTNANATYHALGEEKPRGGGWNLAALEHARRADSSKWLARAYLNLGDSYLKTRDFAESLKYSKEALPLVSQMR